MTGETVRIVVSSEAIHQGFFSLCHSVELDGAGVKEGSAVRVELGEARGLSRVVLSVWSWVLRWVGNMV